MKTEIISFRRMILIGVYLVLIFSLLAIIRVQTRNLVSKNSGDTSVIHSSKNSAII